MAGQLWLLDHNYAYSVYKSCKNAGDSFREITAEVDSLRSFLLALDNEYKRPRSSFRHLTPVQEGRLAASLQDCRADLRSVKAILHDFRSLDTGDGRYRDKLAFTSGKQATIRDKIGAHNSRLQQLLSGLNVATFSRIERNTEAHYLSLLEIHGKLDKIRRDISSGRRNAVAVDDVDEAVALEDEILDDNMTEPDVDLSYEVHEWINQFSSQMTRSANENGHSSRLSPGSDRAALTSFDLSHLNANRRITHNVTPASLVTDAGEQLTILPDGYYGVSLGTWRWGKTSKWWKEISDVDLLLSGFRRSLIVRHPIFYKLELSLEELYFEEAKTIHVRRRVLRPKDRDKVSFEDLSLDVYFRNMLREEKSTVEFLKAGNQHAKYFEDIVFVLKFKPDAVFYCCGFNLAHEIRISIVEAKVGWRREIRHPNGNTIEICANGPTNIRHYLKMRNQGLPQRNTGWWSDEINGYGGILLWIKVTDIEAVSIEQLDQLEIRGGGYFARIVGGDGHIFESTQESPGDVSDFGERAVKHSKLLRDRREQRINDVKWAQALGVKV
ncbi:hypothetical protein J4E93_009933 [Alternaria ventricosa]|uniref:uncharacterized protein n=1 Tax=Alternaria ventricosa TaxID=1187951 RepID=UPI0020C4711D|nr:uncharacterized protein J4E93_009933 [Alternaria ventricosa]KAI4638632.1 hypothetical protein J4E93_009933 [Alternaria ventricosa]